MNGTSGFLLRWSLALACGLLSFLTFCELHLRRVDNRRVLFCKLQHLQEAMQLETISQIVSLATDLTWMLARYRIDDPFLFVV